MFIAAIASIPAMLEYIVTHGTGTRLGDPIEINALYDAFQSYGVKAASCALTSTKTNVGHTFAASGLVSLIGLVEAMRHELIPASLHCQEDSDYIPWEESPFYVNKEAKPWPRRERPRCGAVSAFGMSGTNAHVVVQSHEAPSPEGSGAPWHLLAVSAKTAEALAERVRQLVEMLQARAWTSAGLAALSHTLLSGRQHFAHRAAVVVPDQEAAIYALSQFEGKEALPNLFRGRVGREFTPSAAIERFGQQLLERGLSRAPGEWRDDLHALADLYRQGYDFDWSRLYGAVRPRRLSLPTYPFARERYWVPATLAAPVAAPATAEQLPIEAAIAADAITAQPSLNEARTKAMAALVQMVSELLKVHADDIDVDAELSEFGFDSITLTVFGQKLNERYGLTLAPTVFFEHPTLKGLAEHLMAKYWSVLAKHFSVSAQTLPQASPAFVAGSEASVPLRRQKIQPAQQTLRSAATAESVAIIGVSCCFPQSPDLESFWNNLRDGRDCVTAIPAARWNLSQLAGGSRGDAGKSGIHHAGIIEEMDEFDPLFFRISPREAETMDPQQRLLMTHIWHVIEDAGYAAGALAGSNTGIFVGTSSSGYASLLAQAGVLDETGTTGLMPSIGPNRMSFFLDLHGPSEPIETACSASLVAVHRALQAIHSGECEQAIAGGVNLLISPEVQISLGSAGMLAPDGRCKTFSKLANGYVRGEGAGMLLLKPLSAAERDGDHIYGLIRGSAENHGGRANSLTAPNPKAQAALIEAAVKRAGIDPRSISYIEAHGTGTALGDPIEINGLEERV